MFDTKKIGQRIATLRKASDMTQMDLADRMMVSYQAISNWERGNSMPDISKLPELAKIFGVTIENLLGDEGDARIVTKVIEKEAPLPIEEVAKVIPIMKPSQVEEAIAQAPDPEYMSAKLLLDIAPYLDADRLYERVKALRLSDLNELAKFGPFLDSSHLKEIAMSDFKMNGDLRAVVLLAPFMDSDDLEPLADTFATDSSAGKDLVALAPFLDDAYLGKLAKRILKGEAGAVTLSQLAPFMDEDDLADIIRGMSDEEVEKHIVSLAPFLEDDFVTKLGRKYLDQGKVSLFKRLLPFMDVSDL